ncbi:MAG: hypothetical protein AB1Z65_09525 [Candidatus Sulfomarinibacteraceae bacterium]
MSAAHRTPAARYLALAFAAAALVLPAVMAFAGAFTGIASDGCQSPTAAMAPLLTAAALSGALGTAALISGVVVYVRVPPPRSLARKIELALCSLPVILVLASFGVFIIVFSAG